MAWPALSHARSWRRYPMLILSALSRLNDRVLRLRRGCDDYLTKRFAFDELLARNIDDQLTATSTGADEPNGAITGWTAGAGAGRVWRRAVSPSGKKELNAIHRTPAEISGGNLSKRIAIGSSPEEFAVVARDANSVLDHIQRLMKTARDISNAIAHDLRSPLNPIRGRLEDALRYHATTESLPASAPYTIDEIDAVTAVLDKLLQIAEAESGVRRQHSNSMPLDATMTNMGEL